MRKKHYFSTVTVALAIAVIAVSTAVLSYFSYSYTVGRESLVDISLVQSNIKLATQYVDRIEQKIIENDRTLSDMVDIDEPSKWPQAVEEIKKADLNVEQVYFLHAGSPYPLYPMYSYEIRKSWDAFWKSFRVTEVNLERLAPNQVHHMHKERSEDYFFASYVLKENRNGDKILVVFQMNFEKILAMLDRYLRNLQPAFYVSIVDFDNNGVYAQPIARSSKYFFEMRFPTTLYKWLLQIVPRNFTEIERDARNQRRMNLFLILLSMTMIFGSLAVIYGAGRRERQLAQLKEDFISNVSHELKTPLSLIGMFSEMLVSGRVKNEPSRLEYYKIIHNESERMGRLVANLLDFARLEHREQGGRFESTSIAQLVTEELEAYRHQVEKDGFKIVTDVDDSVPETLADSNAISMALFNLLDNSVKYSRENKEIVVRVKRNDGFIELSVRDEGMGITSGERQKIFEKFYRGRNAAVKNVRGSGIGLSITKHVAEMHGGEILVESEPDHGSTFTLRIPIREEPELT